MKTVIVGIIFALVVIALFIVIPIVIALEIFYRVQKRQFDKVNKRLKRQTEEEKQEESFHDNLSGVGSTKVEIKPLVENQHKDQLWQKYDENNAAKLRRNFRLPPVMVGKTEDLNRATAQESERLSEKGVSLSISSRSGLNSD